MQLTKNEQRLEVSFDSAQTSEPKQLEEASKQLLEACQEAGSDRVAMHVDLQGVRFAPSPLLGVLVLLHQSAQKHGVPLSLANMPAAVRQVFDIARLQELFVIEAATEAQDCGGQLESETGPFPSSKPAAEA